MRIFFPQKQKTYQSDKTIFIEIVMIKIITSQLNVVNHKPLTKNRVKIESGN